MYWMLISRSRRHGLRVGQPFIQFTFFDEEGHLGVTTFLNGQEEEMSFPKIALLPEVEDLIGQLIQIPID